MIQTSFAGLSLRNPIIAASSSRTNNPKHNLALEQAGVGAIVLKSLFEENIIRQSEEMLKSEQHAEAADYLAGYLRSNELNEYIALIKESKALCTVPIIASINAVSTGEWTEFAALIEGAGADALELNIMGLESSLDYKDGDYEQRHIDIARAVISSVKIPVIVKLGAMLTNPVALIERLKAHGAAAVVLFNRMYQADINTDTLEYIPANVLSSHEGLTQPLRWVGIASAKVRKMDFALSGGVQNGNDVVKAILAGAAAVQVCSVLYREGNEWISKAIASIEEWQNAHGYESVAAYRGKMNASGEEEQEIIMRSQFLRHFGGTI